MKKTIKKKSTLVRKAKKKKKAEEKKVLNKKKPCSKSKTNLKANAKEFIVRETSAKWFVNRTAQVTSNYNRRIKVLRVAELFAGVGGFRLGLEAASESSKLRFDVVWSNQWEPGSNAQHASAIYEKRFGEEGHRNVDIASIKDINGELGEIDVLVGGFPCQDYSVARTLNQAAGIVGKKGVLWWEIHRILSELKTKPSFLILENVDRLLKSPADRRGRDFAIMLASLSELGYAVEWRVINAADYGMPQRRRRVFFIGYYKDTDIFHELEALNDKQKWIYQNGILSKAFPLNKPKHTDPFPIELEGDLAEITDTFNTHKPTKSPFQNAGVMIDRKVYTEHVTPNYDGKMWKLNDIIEHDKKKVPIGYLIKSDDIPKWKALKDAKSISRISKRTGHKYSYDEGAMAFPDPLDKPARTIVTGEGGSTPSRFKHVIKWGDGYRRLMPIELEALNMFPPDHTKLEGISDIKRAFLMGNALVVGIIEKIGRQLLKEVMT